MKIESIIALVETLNDIIQCVDEDQRKVAFGTEYRRLANLATERISEEIKKIGEAK